MTRSEANLKALDTAMAIRETYSTVKMLLSDADAILGWLDDGLLIEDIEEEKK